VLARQVLAPPDLERVFNLTGGNIFQGAMTPGQLFSLRPLPGWASYRTPVRGLYLCGAAAHPGGGVMGAPGHNAAMEILRRRRRFRLTT
jgi:phytoene dehydrogenase-like protein